MPEDASTADADRPTTLDDSRIQWRDATSEKGAPFQIGTLKPDDSDVLAGRNEADLLGPTEIQERTGGRIEHNVSGIRWPVGNDSWKEPTQRVTDIVDISRYYLTDNSGWFDYILYITNTQNWNYIFYDETGDGYGLSCVQKTDHYVKYNSEKPSIVRIYAVAF